VTSLPSRIISTDTGYNVKLQGARSKLRRRGLIDLYIDVALAFVLILVLAAVGLSLLASHVGV